MNHNPDHFEHLRCQAQERGERDYYRGVARKDNPHAGNAATDERQYWHLGWDNAREFDQSA